VAELERVDKCGVIDIKEMSSHIYLVPWLPKYQQFLCQWRIYPVPVLPGTDPLPKLAYFVAFKRRESLGVFHPMSPVLVRKILGTEAESLESLHAAYLNPLGFPGLTQHEALSDDDDKPRDPVPRFLSDEETRMNEIKKVLQDKLASYSHEEIQQLLSNLDEESRELLEQVLTEMVQHSVETAQQDAVPGLPPSLEANPDINLGVSPVPVPMAGTHSLFLPYPSPPPQPAMPNPMSMSMSMPSKTQQSAANLANVSESFPASGSSSAKAPVPSPDCLMRAAPELAPQPVSLKPQQPQSQSQQPTTVSSALPLADPEAISVSFL
jgi:hypothetical protein